MMEVIPHQQLNEITSLENKREVFTVLFNNYSFSVIEKKQNK